MMTFTLYPAIDLRHGQVVRLKYGDPDQQTTFSDDPVAIAQQWLDAGAEWLHVVNLDGAFDQAGPNNWQVLPRLTQLGAKYNLAAACAPWPTLNGRCRPG